MKQILSSIMAVLTAAFASCAADSPPTNACPPAVTMLNPAGWQLGTGTYTARRAGDTISLSARGEHPTAGYQVQLAQQPMKIYPPQFALYRKAPAGFAAQVITPFSICVTFKAGTPVESIVVRDSQGTHRVVVE